MSTGSRTYTFLSSLVALSALTLTLALVVSPALGQGASTAKKAKCKKGKAKAATAKKKKCKKVIGVTPPPALGAALAISPNTFDYGLVAFPGSGTTHDFTVTNAGPGASGPITTGLAGGTDAYSITADTCKGVALPAAGTCVITVKLQPPTGSTYNTTVSATGSPGGTASATLTGLGI